MATIRGFVDRIQVGRAGLVVIRLVTDTGRSEYVIPDLDADPERFNERLSKVAIARDAMNRAEPVEIEWSQGKAGNEIDRIARMSRDALDPPASVSLVGGLVIRILLQARNAVQGEGEAHDEARVYVLDDTGQLAVLRLDMQIPERDVACEQLDMIRDAQASGEFANFLVTTDEEKTGEQTILGVWTGGSGQGRGDDGELTVSGFVESLGVILPPGASPLDGTLALANLTTAPEFTGDGDTVDLAPFDPLALSLFVARGSVPYALLEAGLRDNTRVRVRYRPPQSASGGTDKQGGEPQTPPQAQPQAKAAPAKKAAAKKTAAAGPKAGTVRFQPAEMEEALLAEYRSTTSAKSTAAGLLTAAELLAPLASASRPVWIFIDRDMLDRGPDRDDDDCTPGLPTSSLRAQGLRDLRIPYRAEWNGCGCFNHGVYRFELTAPEGSEIRVDKRELCLYPSGAPGVSIAYACLDGDHCVTVVIPDYVCDTEFDLDVYRIR